MSKKVTLLEQAQIEQKKRQFTEAKKLLQNKNLSYSEMLKILLPNFDLSNHDGKPINRNGNIYEDGNAKAWIDAKQTHKGIKGGVRSGKTYTVCGKAILLSFLNRPSYHFSLSPTMDNAIETYVEVLKKLCSENELTYLWSLSKNLFMIYWGKSERDIARILVHGQESEWLGVTAASGDLNEPWAIKKKSFDDWWDRISDPTAKLMMRIWAGTAIPEEMEWGFEYFDKFKFDEPDFYADTFITYGNKYLSEDYLAGQEKHYPTAKEREVRLLGKCIRLSKGQAAYDTFSREHNMKQYIKPSPTAQFGVSFDFNVNPMSATFGEIDGNKMKFREEFQIDNSNTREMCELIINRLTEKGYLRPDGYTMNGTSLLITGDSSGEARSTKSVQSDYQIIIEVFESHGIKIQIALNCSRDKLGKLKYFNPPIRDTLNFVNGMFANETLSIDESCPELLKAMEMTPWKEGATGFTIDENKYRFSHLSATLRYFCWNLQAALTDEEGKHGSTIIVKEGEKR